MVGSISRAVPYLVAATARGEGLEVDDILREAELDANARADEHLEISRYFEVWRQVMTRSGDATFPLRAAAASELEDSEVFGFLAISCQTLGEAYQRTAAYRALYNLGARWDLVFEPGASRLIWQPWPGSLEDVGYRAAMDFQVADMAHSIRRLARARPAPTSVLLQHPAPARAEPYARFYGVAPQFDAPHYELVYPEGLPGLPIETSNSKLRDYFDAACKQLVGKFEATGGVVEQVRGKLIAGMDGSDISIQAVAKQLGMSARSLQRRLAEEGSGYNDILAEVRKEFAKRYLSRGSVSASEVAFLLGFNEPPAFFKAFKRWTGMTPRAFQQLRKVS